MGIHLPGDDYNKTNNMKEHTKVFDPPTILSVFLFFPHATGEVSTNLIDYLLFVNLLILYTYL